MPDVSLLGRVQPKNKSINVEANLLHSWLDRRGEMEAKVKKQILFFVIVFAVSAGIFPKLAGERAQASASLKSETKRAKSLDDQIASAQASSKSAGPLLEGSAMVAK